MTKAGCLLIICALVGPVGCTSPKGATGTDKRAEIEKMKLETLDRLSQAKPETVEEIRNAPGYAVFSNIGLGLLILGTGQGYGQVVDNSNGAITYMRMVQISAGLGVGLKDFRAVFVFSDAETLHRFIEKGWQFGGEAEAGVTSGSKGGTAGGASSTNSKIKIYQFTEAGVVLRAAVPLTKYYKFQELN